MTGAVHHYDWCSVFLAYLTLLKLNTSLIQLIFNDNLSLEADGLTGQHKLYDYLSHKRVPVFEQSSKTGCVVELILIVIHRFTGTLVTLTGTVSPKRKCLESTFKALHGSLFVI